MFRKPKSIKNFKPPASILQTIQENQNQKTIDYETKIAAKQMYEMDPIVKHNVDLCDCQKSGWTTEPDLRTDGLVPKEKELFANPFEPIVGHTGLNLYPEAENDMFQRKMEMFTGNEKTKYFKQKEAVVNDINLLAPNPILNTAVPNSDNRVEFFKQGLLRQGNVKPFETELVGARHKQPIFRPLPKIGAEKYVNPKKTYEYQTLTPAKSNVQKGTLAAQTFKNKVETAFALDRLGFTTTGAITAPSKYGQVDIKYQNRPETAPTGEEIFRNTSPFNNTPLIQKPAENFSVNTAKESTQQSYIPSANNFNSQELRMKSPENFSVNTAKESTQQSYIPSANNFNSQEAHMKGYENYNVNTAKESTQQSYIPSANNFNSQEAHMNGYENYNVNTAKEGLQHKYIPNPDNFNSQPLRMKSPENFSVNTAKEGLQHKYIPNPDNFNGQEAHMKGADNYYVNTAKEGLQHKYIPNPDNFNGQEAHMKGYENYVVNTAKEGLQHKYIPNPDNFNGQEAHMKGADNYYVNTAKEGLQHKYIPNPDNFNGQEAHMKGADNYVVNTAKEGLQHKYIPNPDNFNGQEAHMKGADNYVVNTAKEGLQHKYIPNPDNFNGQEAHMKGADNYVVNTNKEGLQHKYIPNPDNFNGQEAHMKGADNYHVNTEKEQVMHTKHVGPAAPFNDVEAPSSGIGKIHLINKEEILRGRKPTFRGPSITNVDINVGFNKRKQLETRGFLNGYRSTTERLPVIYNIANKEIDITERLDPCLNMPFNDNPYINSLLE